MSEELDPKLWHVPDVTPVLSKKQEEQTNAVGKKRHWVYEAPEEVEEEPVPLTAQEIEEIRQSAFEEGFNQGKEEGFSKGYDEGKAQGHEEGLTKGHEEGIEKGLEEGQDKIEQLAKHWSSLVEQLHTPLASLDKNVEAQLFELVGQLTQAIVLQEAKINPDIVISAISEGLKALPSQEAQTQIYCHPDDIKVISKEFGEEFIKESGWRLLPAPQLEVGSCQVENSTSSIDLSIKTRIKQVLDRFLEQALHQ